MKSDVSGPLVKIFSGIQELRDSYPARSFTIDGRLVGDIGEVLAAVNYGIELFQTQKPGHDGVAKDGRKVQIKATFKESLTFKSVPEHYLGLKLHEDGTFEEIYNGPGRIIFKRFRHRKGIGAALLSFSISELQKLSATVKPGEKLKRQP